MQTLIERKMYIVENYDEYDQVMDLVYQAHFGASGSKLEQGDIADDMELLYPQRLRLFADFPAIVVFDKDIIPTLVPMAKVFGCSMHGFNPINMRPLISDYHKALRSKSLTEAPKIVLNSAVVIKLDENSEPTDEMIRIQFSEPGFTGSTELSKKDRMFIAPKRDVTHLVVAVTHDAAQDRYTAVSCFNHYTFLKGVPELAQYSSPIRWKVSVDCSIVKSEDTAKRYGQYWD